MDLRSPPVMMIADNKIRDIDESLVKPVKPNSSKAVVFEVIVIVEHIEINDTKKTLCVKIFIM